MHEREFLSLLYRWLQQKLETADEAEKNLVFKEIRPHLSSLVSNMFGNYVRINCMMCVNFFLCIQYTIDVS